MKHKLSIKAQSFGIKLDMSNHFILSCFLPRTSITEMNIRTLSLWKKFLIETFHDISNLTLPKRQRII